METLNKLTIGQIVAGDYRASGIFRRHGIDFCCGGERTIEDVCSKSDVKPEALISELEKLSNGGTSEDSYNNWSLDFLVDYIINNHHNKTREVLPEIKFYAEKVATVHGRNHRELMDMFKVVVNLSDEMINHMAIEEEKLFPFIKKLVTEKIADADKNNSAEMIGMMQDEHDEAGKMLKKIRALSGDFTLPEEACNTYMVYFKNLETFETELHKHVHLENNILFPKALKLLEN